MLSLTLLSSALAIVYPLVFREAIDAIGAGTLGAKLRTIEGLFALILVGRLVAGFYPGFRAWMNNIIEKAVRERVFARSSRRTTPSSASSGPATSSRA